MKDKFILDCIGVDRVKLSIFLENVCVDKRYIPGVEEEAKRKELEIKFSDMCKFNNNTIQITSDDIEKEWFPPVNADIFISHSHDDACIAYALKNWIKDKFNLECFIDADVWEHYHILADIITKYDDCGCFNDNIIKSSAILNVALFKMINKCKALFFIKTKHSTINDHQTLSPWIYNEIFISNIMHSKIMESAERYDESVKVLFDTDFSNFRNLTFSDLETWLDTCKGKNIKGTKALDKLLDIVKNKRGGFIKNP